MAKPKSVENEQQTLPKRFISTIANPSIDEQQQLALNHQPDHLLVERNDREAKLGPPTTPPRWDSKVTLILPSFLIFSSNILPMCPRTSSLCH